MRLKIRKTNAVLINNVLHHMNDRQISEALSLIRRTAEKKLRYL